MAPNISLTLNRSDGSVLSDELEESGELDLDDMDTPSDNSNEFEWEGKHNAQCLMHSLLAQEELGSLVPFCSDGGRRVFAVRSY